MPRSAARRKTLTAGRGSGATRAREKGDAHDNAPRHAKVEGEGAKPAGPHSVAVIGAGRLGTALARALAECGYDVKAVLARRTASARRAAAHVRPRPPLALGEKQLAFLPSVDLLFITTPDGAIAEVAARLAARAGGEGGRRASANAPVALHASGALTSDVLAPLRECGFRVGSLHPLASVSDDAASGADNLRRAFYCVEGDAVAARAARRVVRALGAQSFMLRRAQDKSLYHAAAVMTSGHAVALFDLAAHLLSLCGLPARRARRVLLPLLEGTVKNLSADEPARALTGSFARGDAATVRRHLQALRSEPDAQEALSVYALLGAHSIRLAERAGHADPAALAALARLLAEINGKS